MVLLAQVVLVELLVHALEVAAAAAVAVTTHTLLGTPARTMIYLYMLLPTPLAVQVDGDTALLLARQLEVLLVALTLVQVAQAAGLVQLVVMVLAAIMVAVVLAVLRVQQVPQVLQALRVQQGLPELTYRETLMLRG